MVGRRREVDDQRRAGERLVRAGRPRLPDVLADRDADAVLAEFDQAAARRRRRSSAARRRRRSWAGASCGRRRRGGRRRGPRRRCARRRARSGKPTIATSPCVCAREALDRRARVAQEVLLVEQVLGRIAGDRELAEEHQCRRRARAQRRSTPRSHASLAAMSPTVGFELAERQAQRGHARIIEHAQVGSPFESQPPGPSADQSSRMRGERRVLLWPRWRHRGPSRL